MPMKYLNNNNTGMIKKKFKQGIGIAEKSQETRKDHWSGHVNHKSLTQLKIKVCGLHYHTRDPLSCFSAFFSDPYSLFDNLIFFIILVYVLLYYPFMDYMYRLHVNYVLSYTVWLCCSYVFY